MVKLEVATPQTVIAYAQYMEENKYFEDSFRVYEKGIELFDYPHVYPIWLCYLRKFIARSWLTSLSSIYRYRYTYPSTWSSYF